jgi:Rieske Fe-S protein
MIKMPAATKKGGQCFGFPNVCFIPVPPPVNQVPVPFPSTGLLATAKGTVDKVLIEHKETVVQGSKMPSCKGDEPGVKKGVVSQTQSKDVIPKQFSSKVFFRGKKAYHLTAMCTHNGSSPNLPIGAHVAPSQGKVLVGL